MKSQETNIPDQHECNSPYGHWRQQVNQQQPVSMEHQREKSGNQQPAQMQNTTAVQPNPVPAAISTFSPVSSLSSNGFRGCMCASVSVVLAECGINCYVCQRSGYFKFIPPTHTRILIPLVVHELMGLKVDTAIPSCPFPAASTDPRPPSHVCVLVPSICAAVC